MNTLTLYSCIFALIACQAAAQSQGQIANKCIEDLENDFQQDTAALVAELTSWKNVFSPNLRSIGSQCLSGLTGTEWGYSDNLGKFVTQDVLTEMRLATEATSEAVRVRVCELRDILAETNETLQEAEAAQQDRRLETLAATIQECSAWFEDDARGALTNDVCNSIFVSGGLPNSEISGPTTSEALLAEVINTNAKTELEIVIESGMLLETIAAMAAEMGISEAADSYDCDQ